MALFQYDAVEVGERGGIEADRVFDEQYDLHPHGRGVIGGIQLIFDELDDGDKQLGVAEPGEYVVDAGKIFVGHALADFFGEGRQNDNRNIRIAELDFLGCCEDVAFVHVGHDNNQLKVSVGQFLERFFLCRDLCEPGRVSEAERCIFIKNLLVYSSVVLQHEGIIFAGNQQNIVDSFVHQFCKGGITQNDVFQTGNVTHCCLLLVGVFLSCVRGRISAWASGVIISRTSS